MNQISWTDIVTALVAIYGAILATYNLVAQVRKKRPSINVKLEMGFLATARGDTSETMVILSASNSGEKAITLASYGLRLPKNLAIVPLRSGIMDTPLPHELPPEKQFRAYLPAEEVAVTLRSKGFSGKIKLIGRVHDQVGRTYKSKPLKFNVDDWAK